jgi:hypothetical protein
MVSTVSLVIDQQSIAMLSLDLSHPFLKHSSNCLVGDGACLCLIITEFTVATQACVAGPRKLICNLRD